jgi:uncharacterized membrane protein YfcA
VSPTTLPDPDERPEITRAPATALVIGLLAGGLSALLGVGGGLIMVPALVFMLRIRQHRAVGTSLAVILPTAAVAVAQYNFGARVAGTEQMNGAVILWLAIGGVVGAVFGAKLAAALHAQSLRRIFGYFVTASGVWMIVRVLLQGAAGARPELDGVHLAQLFTVGILVGIISGMLGVGGGLLMVPALSLLLKFPQHLAQGTSLAVIIPVSISGVLVHMRRGNVVWPLVGPLALGAVFGAGVVGNLVFKINDPLLRSLFGVFMVLVGISMARTRPKPRLEAPAK